MVNVIKASQKVEPYSEQKILNSLRRARVPKKLRLQVLNHMNKKIKRDTSSTEIYHDISAYLGKSQYPFTKSLYRLKQAIMDFGPTGYPFEDFVAELLSALGYTTVTRQLLMGKCIQHEVDVIATMKKTRAMVEAKFHNAVGTSSDVHVSMYTKARFDDLRTKHRLTQAWIVTNTKVTIDAAAYASCMKMKVIGWDYPNKGNLRDLIEKAKLHPVTMLSSLPAIYKTKLLDNHIVRCKSIHENPNVLDMLSLSPDMKKRVLDEVEFICQGEHI